MKKVFDHILGILLVVAAIGCFCFFFRLYPYHLYHREQQMIFMGWTETCAQYAGQRGCLTFLLSDFLTQYFYYIGIGALIITLLLTVDSFLYYHFFRTLGKCCFSSLSKRHPFVQNVLPALIAMTFFGYEFWIQCGEKAALVPLIEESCFLLLLTPWIFSHKVREHIIWRVILVSVLTLYACFFHTPGFWKEKGGINFTREKYFALDCETYFGHPKKVEELTQKQFGNYVVTYYRNLAMAQQGKLPLELLNYKQYASQGLLLPVRETETPFSIYAAHEAWFLMGDMALAEHAAMLGMIFSPRQTGSRYLKRLAEINLIQGEDEAARKYLRMLSKSPIHRHWAQAHMPGKQTEAVRQLIQQKRALLPARDTLRLAGQDFFSLHHLLENNPQNQSAIDYLLSYELLNKKLGDFARDYIRYANGVFTPMYVQALLIIRDSNPKLLEGCRTYIPPKILQQYRNYLKLYQQSNGNRSQMASDFSHTYWYYYHYAKLE